MCVDTKLLLKVQDGDASKWLHLCYVDTDVYVKFVSLSGGTEEQLNDTLSKWCKEEFNVDLPMATLEDLSTLRDLIKEKYRVEYPDLYRDSKTDRQGWTRIWVTEKMRKETEGNGK